MHLQARNAFRFAAPGGRAGFTLIELMIVIAIMAVVMSVSIPSFYRTLEKDAIRKATQTVLDLCADARAQAIVSGRPCDLIIRPQDRLLHAQLISTDADGPGEFVEETPAGPPGADTGDAGAGTLPEDVIIMFIGVNFVPDLQDAEEVRVRFYPNGTGDEFTLLLRSVQNEWRKFTMDVATGVIKWEVLR